MQKSTMGALVFCCFGPHAYGIFHAVFYVFKRAPKWVLSTGQALVGLHGLDVLHSGRGVAVGVVRYRGTPFTPCYEVREL